MLLATLKEYRAELATSLIAGIKWLDWDMDLVNDYLLGLAIALLIVYRAMKIYNFKKKKQ